MARSLYVHIPYCKTICTYCDFCKMYYPKDGISDYLDALEKELVKKYRFEPLKTIYIGGGTPSCLTLDELRRLFTILDYVNKDENIEYTIECNIDSLSEEKLRLFKEKGINRLSIGIETIDEDLERYLGRKNDKEKIKQIISYAKKIGLTNINVDLMYAMEKETIYQLENDLSFLLSLEVPHISTYSLMLEDHTILKQKGATEIDSDVDAKMYEVICSKLKESGYCHYEISNFAIDGYYSLHNLVYWHNEEYYGIGLGAASYLDSCRVTNTRSISHYLHQCFEFEKEDLSLREKEEYEIMLRLRLAEGISEKDYLQKYGEPIDMRFNYQKLIDQKLIEREEDNLRIREENFYISNYIIEEFLYGKE